MQEKPTSELEEMLKTTDPGQLSSFYRENSPYLADEKKGFYYYFKDTMESKNVFLKDVYIFAGVSESYGGQILRMEKHTGNRDLILRLCIAARFSIEEINRALRLYKMTPLYAKDKRDAALIVALNRHIYDLQAVDALLEEQGFTGLLTEE